MCKEFLIFFLKSGGEREKNEAKGHFSPATPCETVYMSSAGEALTHVQTVLFMFWWCCSVGASRASRTRFVVVVVVVVVDMDH